MYHISKVMPLAVAAIVMLAAYYTEPCMAKLFGMAGDRYLREINPNTGEVSNIGNGTVACYESNGIAYDSSINTMFGYASPDFTKPNKLFIMDLNTGECIKDSFITITAVTQNIAGVKEEYLDILTDGTIVPRFNVLDMKFNSQGQLFMLYTPYAEDGGKLFLATVDKETGMMNNVGGEFTNVRVYWTSYAMIDFDDSDNLHLFIHEEDLDNTDYSYFKHYSIDANTGELSLLSNPAIAGRTSLSFAGAIKRGSCEFFNVGGQGLQLIDMLENEFIPDREVAVSGYNLISIAFTDQRSQSRISCVNVDETPDNDVMLLTKKFCGATFLTENYLGDCNWEGNDGVPCMFPQSRWNEKERGFKGSDWVYCDGKCKCYSAGYPEFDHELDMTRNTRCIAYQIPENDRRCLAGYGSWPGVQSANLACRQISKYDGDYYIRSCCTGVEVTYDDFTSNGYICEPDVNDIRCRKDVGPTPPPTPCILCNPESHEINELEVIFNGEDKTCTEVSGWLLLNIPQTSDVCIQNQEFFSSFCCQARHGETTPTTTTIEETDPVPGSDGCNICSAANKVLAKSNEVTLNGEKSTCLEAQNKLTLLDADMCEVLQGVMGIYCCEDGGQQPIQNPTNYPTTLKQLSPSRSPALETVIDASSTPSMMPTSTSTIKQLPPSRSPTLKPIIEASSTSPSMVPTSNLSMQATSNFPTSHPVIQKLIGRLQTESPVFNENSVDTRPPSSSPSIPEKVPSINSSDSIVASSRFTVAFIAQIITIRIWLA